MDAADSTYLVRGYVPDGSSQAAAVAAATAHPDVVGVFSDPLIESSIVCPERSSRWQGQRCGEAVECQQARLAPDGRQGCLPRDRRHRSQRGSSEEQRTHSQARCREKLDTRGRDDHSGKHPVDHGTMCAYDAGIAAPKATYLDYAVLLSRTPGATAMAGPPQRCRSGVRKLRNILNAMPVSKRAMVVSNSWGMFSPTWDFPPGHPGNYSDNPNHPFNIIVASLEAVGADILFAAGNCGKNCPDGRCNFRNDSANLRCEFASAGVEYRRRRHEEGARWLFVAGARPSRGEEAGCFCLHALRSGRGVYPEDGGTSAACPVAAGVVAAIRSKYPASKLSPLQLRALIYKTAEDRGNSGVDFDFGFGIINPAGLMAALP